LGSRGGGAAKIALSEVGAAATETTGLGVKAAGDCSEDGEMGLPALQALTTPTIPAQQDNTIQLLLTCAILKTALSWHTLFCDRGLLKLTEISASVDPVISLRAKSAELQKLKAAASAKTTNLDQS
jgi:hypothetical protein